VSEIQLLIRNQLGLHARACALFVKTSSKFKAEITVARDDLVVNGKSIMGVMMLAAEEGATIVVRAEGPDEGDICYATTNRQQAVKELAAEGRTVFVSSHVMSEMALVATPATASQTYQPPAWMALLKRTNLLAKPARGGMPANESMNAVIANAFPVVAVYSRSAPFWFFAAMMMAQFLIVLTVYPETKGTSLEQMSEHLGLH